MWESFYENVLEIIWQDIFLETIMWLDYYHQFYDENCQLIEIPEIKWAADAGVGLWWVLFQAVINKYQ